MWGRRQATIDVLAPHSRDLWALAATGNVERICQLLASEPQLATMTGESTPLFWLPDDEQKAADIAGCCWRMAPMPASFASRTTKPLLKSRGSAVCTAPPS
jgi:hypothetical protein